MDIGVSRQFTARYERCARGPATVQGFATQEQCETTGKRFMTSVKKIDWYQCVRADLPPVPVPTPRKAN